MSYLIFLTALLNYKEKNQQLNSVRKVCFFRLNFEFMINEFH